MLGILGNILEVFENIPAYILFAIEELINLFFSSVQLLLEAAVAILPALPETVAPPEYLEAINWFFPLGAILAIATPLLAGYVTFLGVRWIFNKLGEL